MIIYTLTNQTLLTTTISTLKILQIAKYHKIAISLDQLKN